MPVSGLEQHYNCGKRGYISPACPEPRKEWICAEQTQGTLEDMISKSVAAALDTHGLGIYTLPTIVLEDMTVQLGC